MPVKDRFAKACRHAADPAVDDAAHRVAVGTDLLDPPYHGFRGLRIGAADAARLDLGEGWEKSGGTRRHCDVMDPRHVGPDLDAPGKGKDLLCDGSGRHPT